MVLQINLWITTISVVLSTARRGVITGVLLSIARMSGETAPLLLTILGSNFFFSSWNQPIDALPLRIFNDASQTDPFTRQQAWPASMILIMIVLTLNIGVRLATRGRYSSNRSRI